MAAQPIQQVSLNPITGASVQKLSHEDMVSEMEAELSDVISCYRAWPQITTADCVGVLAIMQHRLIKEFGKVDE